MILVDSNPSSSSNLEIPEPICPGKLTVLETISEHPPVGVDSNKKRSSETRSEESERLLSLDNTEDSGD